MLRGFFYWGLPMHITKALAAYRSQSGSAKIRGIEFQLTFKEWCDFWGDDFERRGTGFNQLQMQRIGDLGPYAVGNIIKGYPKQNAITRGCVRRNKSADNRKAEAERNVDAFMWADSLEDEDPIDERAEDLGLADFGIKSSFEKRYEFAANRNV